MGRKSAVRNEWAQRRSAGKFFSVAREVTNKDDLMDIVLGEAVVLSTRSTLQLSGVYCKMFVTIFNVRFRNYGSISSCEGLMSNWRQTSFSLTAVQRLSIA